jgi:hypothetical protein
MATALGADGGTQAGQAAADHEHVGVDDLHRHFATGCSPGRGVMLAGMRGMLDAEAGLT